MRTATYIGDPNNDHTGPGRIIMKKPGIFPLPFGITFKMNVPVEVDEKQHAFLRGHSHFEVSGGDEAPLADNAPRDEHGLRLDGPTIEEWLAAGYDEGAYPPEGYAARKDEPDEPKKKGGKK